MAISVSRSLLVNDLDLVIQAALDGAGLAWVAKTASRNTSRVERRCGCSKTGPPFPGFFLYDPIRKQQPAALSALIEALRL
jgi:DNA-binding transcriptional LysR family regulator